MNISILNIYGSQSLENDSSYVCALLTYWLMVTKKSSQDYGELVSFSSNLKDSAVQEDR